MTFKALAPPALAALLAASPAAADGWTRTLSGTTSGGTPVSVVVVAEFTATGGSFDSGTGTAVLALTLQNVSGLVPFQNPPAGNPALTEVFFNLPPGAAAALAESRALAGGVVWSSGTTVKGIHVPAGCEVLADDMMVTDWFHVESTRATGQFGIFTNTLESGAGARASLVSEAVFTGCTPLGLVYAPLVIGGPVTHLLALSGLGPELDSAADLLGICSVAPGARQPSAIGAKLQGADAWGTGSAFIGELCGATPTRAATWGALKAIFR